MFYKILNGANDGSRTHGLLDGNQMLYQLSYIRETCLLEIIK